MTSNFSEGPTATGPRLLVVEDSDEDFEAISRVLRKLGVTMPVQRCADGDECLEVLGCTSDLPLAMTPEPLPSLILLDLNLPGTDGRDVLRAIKGNSRLKSIPVTVLTTSASPRDVRACYGYGANAYVLKPVDFNLFAERLRSIAEFWLNIAVQPLAPPI